MKDDISIVKEETDTKIIIHGKIHLMELENLKRENDELRHELAIVYRFHNITNIDKGNMLVEQSVPTENKVEIEDSVSENEEESENGEDTSASEFE